LSGIPSSVASYSVQWHSLTGMNFTSEPMMHTLMPHFVMNK
jgi:hypothetical protein